MKRPPSTSFGISDSVMTPRPVSRSCSVRRSFSVRRWRRVLVGSSLLLSLVSTAPAHAGSKVAVGDLQNSGYLTVSAAQDPSVPGQPLVWDHAPTSVSFTRAVLNYSQPYLVSLDSRSGRLTVHDRSGNNVGTKLFEYGTYKRWSGMDSYNIGRNAYVALFDGEEGVARVYQMNLNGSLSQVWETNYSGLRDRQVFDAYVSDGKAYLVAVNTFTGWAGTLEVGGWWAITNRWTTGWSHVEHVERDGRLFRLLYKKGSAFTRQAGRLHIMELDDDMSLLSTVYHRYWKSDYNDMNFVLDPSSDELRAWIVAYRQNYDNNGRYYTRLLDLEDGSAIRSRGVASLSPSWSWDDLHLITNGSTLDVVGIDEDEHSLLASVPEVEGLASLIKQRWVDFDPVDNPQSPPGSQVTLRQYGRIILRNVSGQSQVSTNTEMTSTDRMNMGSVSKMIMSLTILKLADMGMIDLDAPFQNYVDWGDHIGGVEPEGPGWHFDGITVRDLLAHTSDIQGGCSSVSTERSHNFADAFDTSDETHANCGSDGSNQCARVYDNCNTALLRLIAERFFFAFDPDDADGFGVSTVQMQDAVRELWLDGAAPGELTCENADVSHYESFPYSISNEEQYGPSSSCSAGGWKGSADQLTAVTSAIRSEAVVGPNLVRQVRDDSNRTLIWDAGRTATNGTLTQFQKGGDVVGNPFRGAQAAAGFDVGDGEEQLELAAIANTGNDVSTNTQHSIVAGTLVNNF